MDILTREDLKKIVDVEAKNCVSIYLPTHPVGREMQQDPIRLKNLLSEALEVLVKRGKRQPEAESLLEPAQNLIPDQPFWQHQSTGLAVFLTEDFFAIYRLPLDFPELVVVGERFHVKPLLPFFSGEGQFYVLAISQNDLRLLQGSRFLVEEVVLQDVPTSLQEALWADDPERQLQWHTSTDAPRTSGARPAIFHGQGVGERDAKNDILRYFQKIDKGIYDLLANEKAPVVLAGVEYLLPIYREASRYDFLVKQAIEGNPENLSNEKLHVQAYEIVEPIFSAELQNAQDRYAQLAGKESKQTSSDLRKILSASAYGQVDTLFVSLDHQIWGRFDRQLDQVELHDVFQPGDQDLLDLAATQTLTNGGTVYALPVVEMPEESPAAAIFRYPSE